MAPVGSDHDIVRAVELISFEMVRENGVLPIRTDANDRPQYARAIEQSELPVIRAPVRIAQRDEFLFMSVRINPENLVDLLVADVKKPSLVPDWPFGESKSARHTLQLCIARHELPECRRFRVQFEFAPRVFGLSGSLQGPAQEERRNEQGRPFQCGGNHWQTPLLLGMSEDDLGTAERASIFVFVVSISSCTRRRLGLASSRRNHQISNQIVYFAPAKRLAVVRRH
jgi:hypothetical protein